MFFLDKRHERHMLQSSVMSLGEKPFRLGGGIEDERSKFNKHRNMRGL